MIHGGASAGGSPSSVAGQLASSFQACSAALGSVTQSTQQLNRNGIQCCARRARSLITWANANRNFVPIPEAERLARLMRQITDYLKSLEKKEPIEQVLDQRDIRAQLVEFNLHLQSWCDRIGHGAGEVLLPQHQTMREEDKQNADADDTFLALYASIARKDYGLFYALRDIVDQQIEYFHEIPPGVLPDMEKILLNVKLDYVREILEMYVARIRTMGSDPEAQKNATMVSRAVKMLSSVLDLPRDMSSIDDARTHVSTPHWREYDVASDSPSPGRSPPSSDPPPSSQRHSLGSDRGSSQDELIKRMVALGITSLSPTTASLASGTSLPPTQGIRPPTSQPSSQPPPQPVYNPPSIPRAPPPRTGTDPRRTTLSTILPDWFWDPPRPLQSWISSTGRKIAPDSTLVVTQSTWSELDDALTQAIERDYCRPSQLPFLKLRSGSVIYPRTIIDVRGVPWAHADDGQQAGLIPLTACSFPDEFDKIRDNPPSTPLHESCASFVAFKRLGYRGVHNMIIGVLYFGFMRWREQGNWRHVFPSQISGIEEQLEPEIEVSMGRNEVKKLYNLPKLRFKHDRAVYELAFFDEATRLYFKNDLLRLIEAIPR